MECEIASNLRLAECVCNKEHHLCLSLRQLQPIQRTSLSKNGDKQHPFQTEIKCMAIPVNHSQCSSFPSYFPFIFCLQKLSGIIKYLEKESKNTTLYGPIISTNTTIRYSKLPCTSVYVGHRSSCNKFISQVAPLLDNLHHFGCITGHRRRVSTAFKRIISEEIICMKSYKKSKNIGKTAKMWKTWIRYIFLTKTFCLSSSPDHSSRDMSSHHFDRKRWKFEHSVRRLTIKDRC